MRDGVANIYARGISLKLNIIKVSLILLCAAALLGYFKPVINIQISVLGISRESNISLTTVLRRSDSPLGYLEMGQSDLSGLFGDNDMMADIRGRIMVSAISFVMAFALLLIVIVFTVLGKFSFASIIMLSIAIILNIVAGYTFLTLPGILESSLSNLLGFLAIFLNVPEMIQISLGAGYWITMISVAGLLVMRIFQYVHVYNLNRYNKQKSKEDCL